MYTQKPKPQFELQPTLQGNYIKLRPLWPEDFEELYAVASDPLIWEQHPNSDRYQKEVFKSFFREGLESEGALLAIDPRNNQIIGSSRFNGYDQRSSEVEIGWTFLARSYWGGLYNGEMKKLMLNHAFQFVDTVIFIIGETNFRSRKAIEKIGAELAPSRKGRDSCKVVYQITASAWQN